MNKKIILSILSINLLLLGACSPNSNIDTTTESDVILITSIETSKSSLTLTKGLTYELKYEINPINATNKKVNIFSDNTNVIKIINNNLKAVDIGKAIITIKSTDGSNIATSIEVNVLEHSDEEEPYIPPKEDEEDPITPITPIDPEEKEEEEEYKSLGIQEDNILHVWNWNINNIINNLSNIKEAGFKAIQLSPLQIQKDYSTGRWEDNWWKLYQPLSYSVASKSNESILGNKEQLKELCSLSEEYNIKVIMDVVLNHLGGGDATHFHNDVRKYEQKIYDENLLHTFGKTDIWNRTENIVRGAMGDFPDIKSEDTYVQSRAISLLEEYIDCGVDGFRFDAAKHIETPEDNEYASNFWPNVLNTVTSYALNNNYDSPYYYGEILGSPGPQRDFSYYTKYMSVTDSDVSKDILDAVVNPSTSKLSELEYDTNLSGDKVVLWPESHDTYANEDKETTDISIKDINKAYAIISSRKDTANLYFARPINNKNMGEVGVEEYKSNIVKAINKFHNTFLGKNEHISIDNRCFVNVRGNNGATVVNIKNKETSFEIYLEGIVDGVYVDLITDKRYVVSEGKTVITPTDDIVLLKNIDIEDNEPPIINISEYEQRFTDKQNIIINILGEGATTTYKINDEIEKTLHGNIIELPSSLSNGVIKLEIKSVNKYGESKKKLTLYKTSPTLVNMDVVIYNIDTTKSYSAWIWEGVNNQFINVTKIDNMIGFNLNNANKYLLVTYNGNTPDWSNVTKKSKDLTKKDNNLIYDELDWVNP